jgi:hypothetical protein
MSCRLSAYNVDPSTNRSGVAAYGPSGDVTILNGATFAYDPLGMIWNLTSGTTNANFLYTPTNERIGLARAAW